jgi:hypothetical protein
MINTIGLHPMLVTNRGSPAAHLGESQRVQAPKSPLIYIVVSTGPDGPSHYGL